MKKHKHKFQFVEKYVEYNIKEKKSTGIEVAEFICLCGEQKMVNIKPFLDIDKEGRIEYKKK